MIAKLIDSHCHIYPEKIAWKAVEGVDSFYDGLPSAHQDGTTAALKRHGQEVGISHFIVHSVATKAHQVESINRFIAGEVERSEGLFTGLGAMHPDSPSPEKDIEHLQSLGLKGVKLHPDIQKFEADSREAFAIYEICEAKGLPVLVHTGDYRYDYSNPERIVRILRAFPRLKFIGAHFGGWSVWAKAACMLPDYDNIMVDTSSTFPWLKPRQVRMLIDAYGEDRVMFGTDYPLWYQDVDIRGMELLGLTEESLEKICWKNCASLYGLSAENTSGR